MQNLSKSQSLGGDFISAHKKTNRRTNRGQHSHSIRRDMHAVLLISVDATMYGKFFVNSQFFLAEA